MFQTERANEQVEKANELAIKMHKAENAKFVSIISIKNVCIMRAPTNSPKQKSRSYSDFEIINLCDDNFNSTQSFFVDSTFENNSNYPIVQIAIHAGEIGNATHFLYGIKKVNQAIYIPPNGSQVVRIIVPCEVFDAISKYNLILGIELINIFNYVTKAKLHLIGMDDKCQERDWYYRLSRIQA